MNRRDIKIGALASKAIDQIADHLEAARGRRPSRSSVAAEAITRFWRELNRGNLTQEHLASEQQEDDSCNG